MRLPISLLLLAALPFAQAAKPDSTLFGKKAGETEKVVVTQAIEGDKAPADKMAPAGGKPVMEKEGDAPKEAMKPKMEMVEEAKPAIKPKMTEEAEAPKKPMAETDSKKSEAKKSDAEMKKDEADKVKEEEEPTITPFRPAKTLAAKEKRVFKFSNLNKPLAFETTRELQRLFALLTTQYVADGKTFAKAPGPVTAISYIILQDLGEQRYVAKASWPTVGEALPAGTDAWAILLLDEEVKVGATGRMTGTHAGTVALDFTAKFSPIDGKTLTIRREAFVECKPIEESNANLTKFIEQVAQGGEFSVTTTERVACKVCNSLGYTREPQKGKLEDKRIPCTNCDSTGKLSTTTETKFAP
ncbi:MAG: hypothetical protein WCP67_02770 [Verrucomicrobiota bacterium]